MTAIVDVVIPSIGRSSLLRAVASVNAQTIDCRPIVVLDRPDRYDETVQMLEGCSYKILVTSGGSKSANARNMGLENTTAPYVAFLDDDDWWGQSRIENMLGSLADTTDHEVLIASPFTFCLADGSSRTVPAVPPPFVPRSRVSQALPSYLVSRHDLRFGRNAMQTSSLLLSSSVAKKVRWDPTLKKHQDWDFIIRVSSLTSVRFAWSEGTDCYVEKDSPGSISKQMDWSASLRWFEIHGATLNRKARSDFLFVHVLRAALFQQSLPGLLRFVSAEPGIPHLAAAFVGFEGILSGLKGRINAKR